MSTNNLQTVSGILLIDKPVGPTSFTMVQLVRRGLGLKKVGHAGTLDPFASGLLVICVGRPATRRISEFMEGDKVYEATLQLGVETDTQDHTGNIVAESPISAVDREQVEQILGLFKGRQLQTPPAYSALKHKGKPLYYYARKGEDIVKDPREVLIKSIELVSLDKDLLRIKVVCSKGTYIRTLARDIGASLGCGAHLAELRRLKSGYFSVNESLSGSKLRADRKLVRDMLMTNMLPVESVGWDSWN
ncbi:MAG: tRNA pseudouridine(55) synthase TruB [Desulfurivibrionaceae bacterium]